MKSSVSYVALEQLEISIDYQEANEAYTFIHRIFDVFGRILSNVKTHLISFNKKFKRSELRFYHESKRLGINNLIVKKYFDKDMMVPIPSGMKVSYIHAVDIIDKLFEQLNIEKTTDILLQYLKADSEIPADKITKQIENLTKDELEKNLRNVFSSEKTLEVPLYTVIANFQEVESLDKKILQYETVFNQVVIICEKLDLIEKAIDKIVTDLENKNYVDRVYLKQLHKLVKTAAFQYDAYGVCLSEMARVEHNFVLVLEKLVNAAAKH